MCKNKNIFGTKYKTKPKLITVEVFNLQRDLQKAQNVGGKSSFKTHLTSLCTCSLQACSKSFKN